MEILLFSTYIYSNIIIVILWINIYVCMIMVNSKNPDRKGEAFHLSIEYDRKSGWEILFAK